MTLMWFKLATPSSKYPIFLGFFCACDAHKKESGQGGIMHNIYVVHRSHFKNASTFSPLVLELDSGQRHIQTDQTSSILIR